MPGLLFSGFSAEGRRLFQERSVASAPEGAAAILRSVGVVVGSGRGRRDPEKRWGGRRLRKGPPFCRTGGRRSRRRPASARERGTSMCRSTPSAAEQRPSARSGQRFDLPAAWHGNQLTGLMLLPRNTEGRGRLNGAAVVARRRACRAFTSEATTFTFAKDAVPRARPRQERCPKWHMDVPRPFVKTGCRPKGGTYPQGTAAPQGASASTESGAPVWSWRLSGTRRPLHEKAGRQSAP